MIPSLPPCSVPTPKIQILPLPGSCIPFLHSTVFFKSIYYILAVPKLSAINSFGKLYSIAIAFMLLKNLCTKCTNNCHNIFYESFWEV